MKNFVYVVLVSAVVSGVSGCVFAETDAVATTDLATAEKSQKPHGYLPYVRKFADTLLAKGRDTYGAKQTPMLASVIDTQDWSAPQKDVPPPPGVRPNDRALGGSNYYHDVVTTRALSVLAKVVGDKRYSEAVNAYTAHFLKSSQSPQTGLLGWGEHLYYDIYNEKVTVRPDYLKLELGGLWHELVEWTPPWPQLWQADKAATTKAISGLRYHYYANEPDALFNRHAHWDKAQHEKPGGQPWIKHTGLYAYSFMYLHAQTKDPQWLRWGRGAADLYWNRRNPQTNLTLSCIDDPREGSKNASGGQALLAYWLMKAYHANPQEKQLRDRALTLFKAYDRYFYDAERKGYRELVSLEGKPLNDKVSQPWNFAYGDSSLLPYGRIAAYFARTENEKECLEIARRIARLAQEAPIPDKVSLEGVAFAVNLNLDLYDLTKDSEYLNQAQHYADFGIDKFWVEKDGYGLFVRLPQDRYYEAKVGAGDLVAGLLRLHLRQNKIPDPKLYDWSF